MCIGDDWYRIHAYSEYQWRYFRINTGIRTTDDSDYIYYAEPLLETWGLSAGYLGKPIVEEYWVRFAVDSQWWYTCNIPFLGNPRDYGGEVVMFGSWTELTYWLPYDTGTPEVFASFLLFGDPLFGGAVSAINDLGTPTPVFSYITGQDIMVFDFLHDGAWCCTLDFLGETFCYWDDSTGCLIYPFDDDRDYYLSGIMRGSLKCYYGMTNHIPGIRVAFYPLDYNQLLADDFFTAAMVDAWQRNMRDKYSVHTQDRARLLLAGKDLLRERLQKDAITNYLQMLPQEIFDLAVSARYGWWHPISGCMQCQKPIDACFHGGRYCYNCSRQTFFNVELERVNNNSPCSWCSRDDWSYKWMGAGRMARKPSKPPAPRCIQCWADIFYTPVPPDSDLEEDNV